MPKIAVIGDKDSILGFKAVGVTAFPAGNEQQVRAALKEVAGDDTYGVVFITEQAAAAVQETVLEFMDRQTPILIPIPSSQGSLGIGMDQIRRNVEKAVGADILFGKEGR